jgi:hypothetical protein
LVKDRFTIIAATDDVIDGTGKFQAGFSGHEGSCSGSRGGVNM